MKYFSRTLRFIRINFVMLRYNLDEYFYLLPLFAPFRFFRFFNPWYWRVNKIPRGQRLRLALESLGPIFIKAGQVLSTRRDLLPDDIAIELAKLQDRVPPFPGVLAKQNIEKSLGLPLRDVFREFDLRALASASIAQVHPAVLLDGSSVVVKVLRPGIRKIIDRDLDLLFSLVALAEKYSPDARRFKPHEIVEEVAHSLYDELDLMREGANASQLRRNFSNSHLLYIPVIHWAYCRTDVLVMERIDGISIYNTYALEMAGINLKTLAERGVEIFFTQVFRDSFFHADMHPGNVFVSTKNIEDPQYIAVDFGIVGSLSKADQRYLAENMLAFFKRDYQRVAELHVESGWLAPDTRIDQFEGAIRAVCEPIFEKPLKDISFGQLLLRLFQTARRFNINIQPQLILLQKTLLSIEGLGRQLYPELDLWTTASPYLEKWLKKQVGPRAFLRRIRENFPYWSEKLPDVPDLIYDVLQEKKRQYEVSRFDQRPIVMAPSPKSARRQLLLCIVCGLVLSCLIIYVQPIISFPLASMLVGLAAIIFLIAEII